MEVKVTILDFTGNRLSHTEDLNRIYDKSIVAVSRVQTLDHPVRSWQFVVAIALDEIIIFKADNVLRFDRSDFRTWLFCDSSTPAEPPMIAVDIGSPVYDSQNRRMIGLGGIAGKEFYLNSTSPDAEWRKQFEPQVAANVSTAIDEARRLLSLVTFK